MEKQSTKEWKLSLSFQFFFFFLEKRKRKRRLIWGYISWFYGQTHDALPMNSTSNKRTESGGIIHEPVIHSNQKEIALEKKEKKTKQNKRRNINLDFCKEKFKYLLYTQHLSCHTQVLEEALRSFCPLRSKLDSSNANA